MTSPSPTFFRAGAAAAAAAVLGIVLAQIVFTPKPPAPGIEGLLRAYAEETVQAQSLTIILQVIAMFLALLVLSVKVFLRSPGPTVLAMAFLVLWQVLELVPRSIDYFVFSLEQAPAYVAGSGNPAQIERRFGDFIAWESGLRSMRQVVWATGLFLIGLAAWHVGGWSRWVAAMLMLNGLRVGALFGASMLAVSLPLGTSLFVSVNIPLFCALAAWLWVSPWPERHGPVTPATPPSK